jgi:two-component system, OmpR family, sensor histidine kinase BaeS
MRINRLSLKLLLAFLALTLASLALSGAAINWALNYQFRNYIGVSREAENLRIVDTAAAYYAEQGSWRGIAATLAPVAISTETLIILYDGSGNLVYNSRRDLRGVMGFMGSRGHRWEIEGDSFVYPVLVEDRKVGTLSLTLLGREGTLAQEDLDFSSAVNLSILVIALLAGLGALAMSLFMSRRLTRPLVRMTAAVSRLKEGDLSQRVEAPGRDELGLLAQSFNSMADRLEKTEKLRRKLSADISHELRTPLANLKSYLEAFKDGVLPASQENIASLQEEVLRLENLVQNLQELSLVENRSLNLPLKALDPAPVLQKIFELYQPLMAQQDIAGSLSLPSSQVKASLNEEALERILHNLLSNALKYTPGGGAVSMKAAPGPGPRPALIIEVSDTGPGISGEDLPHIFERFYRADPSRSRGTGGYGIGLTIARELAEAQGGTIQARSRPGEGATFVLEFPAAT